MRTDRRFPYTQPAYGAKNSSKVLNHFQMLVGSISNHPFHSLFVIPGAIFFCKLLNIQLIDKLNDNLFNRLFNLKTFAFNLIKYFLQVVINNTPALQSIFSQLSSLL